MKKHTCKIASKVAMTTVRAIMMTAAMVIPISATVAAVNNLESYHFRYDFSTGARVFTGGPNCPRDSITDTSADTVAVEGPNGPGTAMHLGNCSVALRIDGEEIGGGTSVYLNTNAWTLAMSFRPGSVEKGMLFSVGRLNGGARSGRIAITVCSSSDPSKLYLQEFYRGADGSVPEKGNSVTLTGLGNMTNGFHTLVTVYSPSDKTITPYVDGTKKTVLTLSSKTTTSRAIGNIFHYGSFPSITGDVSGFSRSYTNNDVAFYDTRFYFGAFDDSDATAYAALYPADRMGSPFRPSAYIEAGATNTISDARNITTPVSYVDTGYIAKKGTEFTLDFQYLDCATIQQYAFGIWNGNASSTPTLDGLTHCFYINGNNGLAFTRFSGTSADWHAITENNAADRIRRIMTVKNKDASDTGSTATILAWSDRSTMATSSITTPHAVNAKRSTYLFAINTSDTPKRFSKARIYSFEADEGGAPAAFFAPDMDNGEAGFRNIIDGSFHGDGNKNNNPERPLRFYDGVGRASDYKYENGTLYAKLYASVGDSSQGMVSVASGAAAASAEGWVPRGGALVLSATASDPSKYEFGEWTGDTWAIADGFSKTNASIEVSTPYAVQLRAVFSTTGAQLVIPSDYYSDSLIWSEADWCFYDGDYSVTIPAPVSKDVTIVAHKSITVTLDTDVSLNKFTVVADTDCVVTVIRSGGSFYANEVVVASGVLQQGSNNVFGGTPKFSVLSGGTFDINSKTIRQEMPIYIEGSGSGSWPWALGSSSGAMVDGNYLFDLYLTGDATTGGGQLKLGRSAAESYIYLNGYTLTAKSWLTLRNINTKGGTIDIQGSASLNTWNNLNSLAKNRGTTLIINEGETLRNNTDRTIKVSNLIMNGGSITKTNADTQKFGVISELHGHGLIEHLVLGTGSKFYPDGRDYLHVTGTISGKLTVSLIKVTGLDKVPLLKVPVELKATADSALDLSELPEGWRLKSKDNGDSIEYWAEIGCTILIL